MQYRKINIIIRGHHRGGCHSKTRIMIVLLDLLDISGSTIPLCVLLPRPVLVLVGSKFYPVAN